MKTTRFTASWKGNRPSAVPKEALDRGFDFLSSVFVPISRKNDLCIRLSENVLPGSWLTTKTSVGMTDSGPG